MDWVHRGCVLPPASLSSSPPLCPPFSALALCTALLSPSILLHTTMLSPVALCSCLSRNSQALSSNGITADFVRLHFDLLQREENMALAAELMEQNEALHAELTRQQAELATAKAKYRREQEKKREYRRDLSAAVKQGQKLAAECARLEEKLAKAGAVVPEQSPAMKHVEGGNSSRGGSKLARSRQRQHQHATRARSPPATREAQWRTGRARTQQAGNDSDSDSTDEVSAEEVHRVAAVLASRDGAGQQTGGRLHLRQADCFQSVAEKAARWPGLLRSPEKPRPHAQIEQH